MSDSKASANPPGTWRSPLTAAGIFQGRQTPSFPLPWGNGVAFLLTMPEEGNAHALMYAERGKQPRRISPEGFNLRTRVHEYGGLPYALGQDEVFFCNFSDQAIYRQRFDPRTGSLGEPTRLTALAGTDLRYAELLVDSQRRLLYCVREDHRNAQGDASKVRNELVAIPLDRETECEAHEHILVFGDSDFVSNLALSPDSSLLAFITWSHPAMPFDNTELRVATLDEAGDVSAVLEVDQGTEAARLQPGFDESGDLFFLADYGDYWNLFSVPGSELKPGCRSSVAYEVPADCCGAPWETGKRNWAIDEGTLYISVVRECFWELHAVSLADQAVKVLEQHLGLLEQLRLTDATLSYLHAGTAAYPAVSRRKTTGDNEPLFVSPLPEELKPELVSRPEHFAFPSHAGSTAYALLYRPCNPGYAAEPGDTPLLINVHGGPTGTARAALNPMHQFWTSRGFAVLDLNHRGSTGYGRRFRQLLYGQWGVVDIQDIEACVGFLIASGQVAPDRIAIRGGSAGGYAVLASLAACDLFSAGTSYYGVADLELLARDTHKFESRYLDQLIGPYPAARERYVTRSPIHRLDAITAPLLLLQGEDDPVVPKNQAEIIYNALRTRNPATEYLCFEGEAHGFRNPTNQIRALEAELAFYQRNLLGKVDT